MSPALGAAVHAFPGVPASVGAARRWVRGVLALADLTGEPADTAVLLVSELATNSLAHTASGEAGGWFRLRVRCGPQRVRVECEDAGNRTGARPRYAMSGPEDTRGRGLALVAELADAFGDRADATGRTVFFELHRSPSPPTRRGAP
ncbi:ATP-binding protein [Allonocardiopsis opalescens]|nr:ATP-binding protein [Allonocardiopsis opalescens]